MRYTYRCDPVGDDGLFAEPLTHRFELTFPCGHAPGEVPCAAHSGEIAVRDIMADIATLTIDAVGDDPFRKYHLSGQSSKAAEQQQRHIGGPKDRSEARAIEAATGRKYIGNNTDSLTSREQRALESRGYGKVD